MYINMYTGIRLIYIQHSAVYLYMQLHNIIDEFKKFAILKKGIGIESQNLYKQFNNQKL